MKYYFTETITPRESSDDTGDKVNVHVESSEAAEVDENKAQSVRIVKTSVEMDAKSTQPQIESEQQAASASGIDNDDSGGGAVGGVDDDSVFVDAAIPSTSKTPGVIIQSSSPHRSSIDNDDEVDDIELILSSDDKEYPQEDMVSISYYEPWQLCGQSGTPILVNFNNISSDNEGGDDENREQLSPSPIDPDQFYNAIKENVAQQQLSLESSDSLSLGDNLKRSYDFHSKSFSLERRSKTSDENGMMRDESFDTFEQVSILNGNLKDSLEKFVQKVSIKNNVLFFISQSIWFIVTRNRLDFNRPWAVAGQITTFFKRPIYRNVVQLKKMYLIKDDETHAPIPQHTDQSFTVKRWDDF